MPESATITRPDTRRKPKVEQPRLWNVVLLDDQEHTYEYVVDMMQRLFAHSFDHALRIAKTVDTQGRAICKTTHRELGELKVEQIRTYGPDRLSAGCKTSMAALLEPADCGDGASDDERGA